MLGILAKISFLMSAVMTIWIIVCLILILIILVQKGKGGGLSGAFGGAGTGGGLLGTKTGDFLTWVTISFVGLFFLLAIVMGIFLVSDDTDPAGATMIPQTQTPVGDVQVPQEDATPTDAGQIPADDTENAEKPAQE